MAQVLVFDIGGVLAQENREEQYARLAEEFHYRLEFFFASRDKYLDRCATGELSGEEYVGAIANELGIEDVEAYRERWLFYAEQAFAIDEGVLALVTGLKDRFTLVAFTNIIPLHETVRELNGVYESFSIILRSFTEGLKKPDARFYERLLEKAGVPASDIILVDDHEPYLVPARDLGMDTIHFRSAAQLEKELREFGID